MPPAAPVMTATLPERGAVGEGALYRIWASFAMRLGESPAGWGSWKELVWLMVHTMITMLRKKGASVEAALLFFLTLDCLRFELSFGAAALDDDDDDEGKKRSRSVCDNRQDRS